MNPETLLEHAEDLAGVRPDDGLAGGVGYPGHAVGGDDRGFDGALGGFPEEQAPLDVRDRDYLQLSSVPAECGSALITGQACKARCSRRRGDVRRDGPVGRERPGEQVTFRIKTMALRYPR